MRNKIEVGDYIRTKNGKIRKVKDIVAQYYITDRINISDNNQFVKEDIVKHSKNKIDLFEDKDIIKIKLSEKYVHNKQQQEQFMIAGKATTQISTIKEDVESGTYEIISILTYEQFKEREYVF